MPTLLRMPGIAADTGAATLTEWQVSENIPYAKSDVLAAVETDKAMVDIEAEEDGVILRFLVGPGTEVQVGAPIAVTGAVGESIGDLDAVISDAGAEAPQRDRLFATPLVRRIAEEANLDLGAVQGTGPQGRIVRRDIQRVLAARLDGEAAAERPSAPPATAEQSTAIAAPFVDEPHSRVRMATAIRLTESKRAAPHFYMRGTCRVDTLLAFRDDLNRAVDVKVSVNDLIVKAAARAHTIVPAMNVMWTDDATRRFEHVDIAVAVATPRGLVTPVVSDVARRSISAVASDIRDLSTRARDGKLSQHEIEGGAFCVSNLGMYGTEDFAAIINPPQSAILAVGGARQEAVVEAAALVVGTMIHVTLSVDHRPIDGTTAAEWMRAFIGVVENPVQILV